MLWLLLVMLLIPTLAAVSAWRELRAAEPADAPLHLEAALQPQREPRAQ
jgi:hypothetical protein